MKKGWIILTLGATALAVVPMVHSSPMRSEVPLVIGEQGNGSVGLVNHWTINKHNRETEAVLIKNENINGGSFGTKKFMLHPNEVVDIPDVQGGKLRALPGRHPESFAIAPDGVRLVVTDRMSSGLWMIDTTTDQVELITSDSLARMEEEGVSEQTHHHDDDHENHMGHTHGAATIWATAPFWSADGHWIAYASNRFGGYGVIAVRADGSDEKVLLVPEQIGSGGSAKPLGWIGNDRLMVLEPVTKTLYSVGLDGTHELISRDILPASAALSPTGLYLAAETNGGGLTMVDTVSGENYNVALPAELPLHAQGVWSPDGKHYVFAAYGEATSARELQTRPVKLVVVDMTGDSPKVHTFVPKGGLRLDHTVPVQWLDSEQVLTGLTNGKIWTVSMGGGQ